MFMPAALPTKPVRTRYSAARDDGVSKATARRRDSSSARATFRLPERPLSMKIVNMPAIILSIIGALPRSTASDTPSSAGSKLMPKLTKNATANPISTFRIVLDIPCLLENFLGDAASYALGVPRDSSGVRGYVSLLFNWFARRQRERREVGSYQLGYRQSIVI